MSKKVWQKSEEWQMLYCMVYSIMNHGDYNRIVNELSHEILGDALEKVVKTPRVGSSYLILTEFEMEVLLSIVNWYDEMMISIADYSMKVDPQFFTRAYFLCGKVKRNLVLYSTIYEAA